jgi:RNA polymerase sigma factor (sigma-70 family)
LTGQQNLPIIACKLTLAGAVEPVVTDGKVRQSLKSSGAGPDPAAKPAVTQATHAGAPIPADDSIPTRQSLLGRLKDWQDNESWQEFFDTYWKLIYHFALQRGLTHQEAEEAVQETVIAVARNMPAFHYDPAKCAFKSWLLTVTRSKIANQFEKRARQQRVASPPADDDSRATPWLERVADEPAHEQWESAWDEEWRDNLMDAAIQRVKRRVSIEQFQMFDLFALKGWPAGEVAKTIGVTVAHVYVARHRINKIVRKELALMDKSGI